MAEFNLINQIINTQKISRSDVNVGIGDDCALLKPANNALMAVSMDTLVSGVHFLENTPAYYLGYKSLAVNLSDLAATGAEPAWATLSLTMPEQDSKWLEEFMRGFFELADKFNVQLVGGDTTQGSLSITVQVHGFSKKPLLRSNAKENDLIYVSGHLGDAATGFEKYKTNFTDQSQCINRFLKPEPRVELGSRLINIASSCIDVSDGLVSDLGHICNTSQTGADIFLDQIQLSEEYRLYNISTNLYANAVSFGDDYELCFTVPVNHKDNIEQISAELNIPLSCIGKITTSLSLDLFDKNKNKINFNKGYQHFNE